VSDGGDLDVKRCAKCAALIPASATMCAYCNTSSPDEPLQRSRGSVLSIRHGIRVTDVLIIVNVAYLLFAAFAEYAHLREGNPLQWILTATGFGEGLWRAGAYRHEQVASGQWWRIVTATFLHAGALHIAVNMFSLRNLGHVAEELFGPAKLLVVYLVSGACSALAVSVWFVWILKRPPGETPGLVGASGAIFGIAGLLVVYLLRAGTDRGRQVARSLAMNLGLMLLFGWYVSFISNTGHVGGLVAGLAFGLTIGDKFTGRINPASRQRWSRAAVLCVAFAGAALLAGAWFAVTYKGTIQ
jgi:rhomboid protease GluP